jgi:hypothetical protein
MKKNDDDNKEILEAYWNGCTKEQYYFGRTGENGGFGFFAAFSLMEGNYEFAIEYLEAKGGEIAPVFLETILLMLKGEAFNPAAQETFGFKTYTKDKRRGAPDKAHYFTELINDLKIGSLMHQRYKIDGEKYENAATEVAKVYKVSERTVKSIYSWYKEHENRKDIDLPLNKEDFLNSELGDAWPSPWRKRK